MMSNEYVLFFAHAQQVRWFSLVAGELRRRHGLRSVLWVLGGRDRAAGEAAGVYDEVSDLLRGFDPRWAGVEYSSNIARLTSFEERCGEHFYHEALAIDRYIYLRGWSAAEAAHYAVHLLTAMERRLDAEGGRPLCALGENNTLPYRIAHRLLGPAVPYWYVAGARQWEERFHLDPDAAEMWPECRRLYAEYRQSGIPRDVYQIARDRLEYLRRNNVQPLYTQLAHRGSEGFGRKLRLNRVSRVLREFTGEVVARRSRLNPQMQTARALSPAHKVATTFREEARKRFFDRSASPRPPEGGRYATYFLHVQPEYSVDGYAFEFRDQPTVIENIAAALPADCRLVVKEHKPMVGMRETGYYRRLMRIQNVTLLTDRFDSYELIRGSKAVFTLSGTAALVAMSESVPAVVFGDVFFDCFEGIHKVKTYAQLKEAVARVMSEGHPRLPEDAPVAALAAMYSASYPGKFGDNYGDEELREAENLDRLMAPFEKELRVLMGRDEGRAGARLPRPDAAPRFTRAG